MNPCALFAYNQKNTPTKCCLNLWFKCSYFSHSNIPYTQNKCECHFFFHFSSLYLHHDCTLKFHSGRGHIYVGIFASMWVYRDSCMSVCPQNPPWSFPRKEMAGIWFAHGVWAVFGSSGGKAPSGRQSEDSSKHFDGIYGRVSSSKLKLPEPPLWPRLLTSFIFQNRLVSSFCLSGTVLRPTTALTIWRGWVQAGPCQKMSRTALIIYFYKQLILASGSIVLTPIY